MSRPDAKFSSGVLFPSADQIKQIVRSLQKKVKEDPQVAKLFKKDPRRTLANFGVNEDVQNQLLKEMGIKASAARAWCVCTGCCKTCWTTDCCFTEITIVIK